MSDFLKRGAQTPLQGYFLAAGAVCKLSTNSEAILEAVGQMFSRIAIPAAAADFSLRFWVDRGLSAKPPWPKPYVRGMGNLIFAGLDLQNSFLVDRRTLRVIGRFSPAMAADQAYWRMAILPLVISLFGASIGSTEIHCGCVASKDGGVLLAGRSGSGKSTLAWALARLGFSFLSDDRTYLSRRGGELLAWSASPRLKLRPEALTLFQELGHLVPDALPDGERAYHFEPEHEFGVSWQRFCKPRWLIFLERREGAAFDLTPLEPAEAVRKVSLDMLAETPEVSKIQLAAIADMAQRGCWQLAYDGEPSTVAKSLALFCEKTMASEAR